MQFIGILGIIALFGIAYLLSENRQAIKWRTVLVAFAIQLTIGVLVLKWEAGRQGLSWFSGKVQDVINYANEGIAFLFGGLADPATNNLGFIFAFKVLPVIVFFSALIGVLFHLGIMQFVINILGAAIQKLLGTSKKESLSATANIFLGQTEAPLVIKPYMNVLTRSEMFAVMVGGLASVAGSVLAGYAGLGVKLEYLITASFMAAPAGLLMAKLIVPETEEPKDNLDELDEAAKEDKASNVIDAAARGASDGLQIALNVGAMLLAFVSLIALLNGIIGGIGGWFGYGDITLQVILGYLLAPIAFLIGVPAGELVTAGSFIGQKFVMNEFVAYVDFAKYLPGNELYGTLSDRTLAIISFALCGFANLSSMAILLGGLGSIAPKRRTIIAQLGFKAVIAGTLANLMTATIAGLLI
ncbi:NupC/NupG family nucleoside CNT transporter [Priestia taiwanensis]|uniref:Nucleoside permease n=1 Tax=Priestia taiwanensis TaxID=1347902 RepID=A0A917ETW5_9BACI|nr:NupC/NupG family nucleoside CNT transporter [Priestia taiwanensis]MBM7364510.1 CNT family concentrative nucleoside transporter [Priestia taiwanensis]GGE80938.1 nucleoside permease [Priestia taiwanensis]